MCASFTYQDYRALLALERGNLVHLLVDLITVLVVTKVLSVPETVKVGRNTVGDPGVVPGTRSEVAGKELLADTSGHNTSRGNVCVDNVLG